MFGCNYFCIWTFLLLNFSLSHISSLVTMFTVFQHSCIVSFSLFLYTKFWQQCLLHLNIMAFWVSLSRLLSLGQCFLQLNDYEFFYFPDYFAFSLCKSFMTTISFSKPDEFEFQKHSFPSCALSFRTNYFMCGGSPFLPLLLHIVIDFLCRYHLCNFCVCIVACLTHRKQKNSRLEDNHEAVRLYIWEFVMGLLQ